MHGLVHVSWSKTLYRLAAPERLIRLLHVAVPRLSAIRGGRGKVVGRFLGIPKIRAQQGLSVAINWAARLKRATDYKIESRRTGHNSRSD